jgi:hypothetical protein
MLLHRLKCALGLHSWKLERYWSINECWVEGRVCAHCTRTHRERRRV